MNLYIQTFFEAAHAASIIPGGSESGYIAMRVYGGHDMPIACFLAVAGATLGHIFNFSIGKILLSFYERGKLPIKESWYRDASYLFNRFGIFLLLLCWMPMVNILTVVAAFLGVRFYNAMIVIVVALVSRYIYLLL